MSLLDATGKPIVDRHRGIGLTVACSKNDMGKPIVREKSMGCGDML